ARLPSADPRCVAGMQRTEDQPHPRTGSHRVVRAAQIDAVEQVKDFHPELRGHLLRHYRRSFENREIERREPRTVELVPGGVPEVAEGRDGEGGGIEPAIAVRVVT